MRCFTKITDTKFARTSIPTTKTMRACCSDAGDFQRPSREISLGIDHILLVADTTKPVSKHKNTTLSGGVFLCVPRRSPSCQPAAGGYRSRQPGHFLESASLHPPQAALRRFPRRPLQKRKTPTWVSFFFWSSTFATQKWSPAGG